MNTLPIISEHPLQDIWNHLSQYESTKLALKLIQRRANTTLPPTLAEKKALGLAYCLRNAREYLQQTEVPWTTRLLNGYYGMMALTGALMIADPNTPFTLQDFEGFTKKGHGLSNIDSDQPFPEGQRLYVTHQGLFQEFAKYLQIDLSQINFKRRPETLEDLHKHADRHLSLGSLLARIPEVAGLYFNVTGKPPLCSPFELEYPPVNGTAYTAWQVTEVVEDTQAPDAYPFGLCFLLTSPHHHTLEDCSAMQKDFQHLHLVERTSTGQIIRGFVLADSEEACLAKIPRHQSALAKASWFDAPFGEVKDMLAVHFMLTYHLSIIVRYRPSLWREITEGQLDDYFSLIRQYHQVFTRVVPQMVLERLEGRDVEWITLQGVVHG